MTDETDELIRITSLLKELFPNEELTDDQKRKVLTNMMVKLVKLTKEIEDLKHKVAVTLEVMEKCR